MIYLYIVISRIYIIISETFVKQTTMDSLNNTNFNEHNKQQAVWQWQQQQTFSQYYVLLQL